MTTSSSFELQHNRALPDIGLLKLLYSLLRSERRAVLVLVALGVCAALSEGIGLGLFIPFLQTMGTSSHDGSYGSWLGNALGSLFADLPQHQRLFVISMSILLSVVLKGCLSYATSLLFTRIGVNVGHRLRQGIFDQVLTVDYRYLNAAGSAKFLNALHTESWRTVQAISTLLGGAISLTALAIYLALLILLSWQLTLVVIVLMSLIALLVQYMMRGVGQLGSDMTRANAAVARRMVDGVDGIEVIRAFAREAYERTRFTEALLRLNRLLLRLGALSGAIYPIYEVLAAAILVGVLSVSMGTPTDLAPLLVFVFLLYRLEPKAKELDRARVDLIALEAAVRETLALVDRGNKQYVTSGPQPFRALRRSIRVDHVTFAYDPDGEAVLRDVSIELPARSTIALVGPSGAGKSTLAKLLLRFYDPLRGQILIDDTPLARFDLDAWRSRLSLVSQKVFLFSATVFENIAYGKLDASEADVTEAARQAGAHEFIVKLPSGYHTGIGEGGAQLSGGQEQRISLARAIVRKPELLILDEATNALDTISERLVQAALDTLRHRCTTLVIAHRLSTVERADHIVVLEDGRIAEQGSLESLIQLDGLFARLYRAQRSRLAAG